MANTSIGWQAVSREWLVREVAGSKGAAGGKQGDRRVETLTKHGRCCFCLIVGVSAIDRWCL
jgi:hypothetical protein